MKISDQKRQQIYNAIADNIMDLRIDVQQQGVPAKDRLDKKLFQLELDIWESLKSALRINE